MELIATTLEFGLRRQGTSRGKKVFYQVDTYVHSKFMKTASKSATIYTGELQRLLEQYGEKYFDYSVFNIVDSGFPRSGARRRALAQNIGHTRGLDINSPRSAENHPQDLRFCRHQQHGDPNSARGLDSNFASNRDCDSTITTRLHHYRLRPRRPRRIR
jgi:hypothetical protein